MCVCVGGGRGVRARECECVQASRGAYLVVALARGAVRHELAALLLCDCDLLAGGEVD